MAQLRVALAQVDTTVGDLSGNADTALRWTTVAAERGAHLVAFPEMALTGYPPEDLVFRESFRSASMRAVTELAGRLAEAGLGDTAVVVGYLDSLGGPRNAAALLYGGRVVARYFKHHLPNYGVFDEARYFVRGDRFVVVRLHGVDLALTVCEDMWQDGGPFAVANRAGVALVLNINGSPYERNKDDVRLPLARRRAAEAGAAVAYVNMVGAQDELVYDGDSFVVAADGTLLARAPQYEQTLLVADLDLAETRAPARSSVDVLGMTIERRDVPGAADPPVPAYQPEPATIAGPLSDEEEVWQALVVGTRDYVRKNGFRSVVIGLSGGIDSAVTAAIATDAIGADRVHGVSMPSSYSSEHSRTDAAELARRLGCSYQTVPIAPMVDAFLGALPLSGLAEENVQSRVRGTTLMGLSNQYGHLVLATGNKSELSVGYSTLYGDSVGGYAPLKDVPKTLVWRLARWRNAVAHKRGQPAPIPESSISKPPSAELRPGQLDTDSLPSYEALDAVLADYVDRDLGWAELVAAGHDPALVERVIRLVDRAEYKRRQYPPGPKISLKAFGRDRRLPISSRWNETAPAGALPPRTAEDAERATPAVPSAAQHAAPRGR
jgi:NAD+ synthase (glutamine-hydrolysing)